VAVRSHLSLGPMCAVYVRYLEQNLQINVRCLDPFVILVETTTVNIVDNLSYHVYAQQKLM